MIENRLIIELVTKLFSPEERESALELLEEYGRAPHDCEVDRVRGAIVFLSKGELKQLKYLVSVAKVDYRDVLSWQEIPVATDEDSEKKLAQAHEILRLWGNKS